MLLLQVSSLPSEVTGYILSISSPDCHLHNVCEWPRGDVGGPVLWDTLSLTRILLAAEELCGALQLLA